MSHRDAMLFGCSGILVLTYKSTIAKLRKHILSRHFIGPFEKTHGKKKLKPPENNEEIRKERKVSAKFEKITITNNHGPK